MAGQLRERLTPKPTCYLAIFPREQTCRAQCSEVSWGGMVPHVPHPNHDERKPV